jgi:carbon starvation protein
MNKAKYAWVTAVPGICLACITMWAGYIQITTMYIPQGRILLASLGCLVLGLMIIVLVGSIKRWFELLQIRTTTVDAYGDTVLVVAEE